MEIIYKIKAHKPYAHIFKIELIIKKPEPKAQILSLPNWIAGSYLIRDFAKNIISIAAKAKDKKINIDKFDKNHWLIGPCSEELLITYEVYAFDLSVRSAYLDDSRGFFNANSVFLKVHNQEQKPCSVEVYLPNNKHIDKKWNIASNLKLINANNCSKTYYAKNYYELLDNPFEMSDFVAFNFKTDGICHEMLLSGNQNANIKKLKKDLKKVCSYHIKFFKAVPFNKYLFLVYVTPNGYGGLEHKASSSLICNNDNLPKKYQTNINKNYANFLALCSHEYFHAWWVKTIRPKSFINLDLNKETYSKELWIFEGFTSYYDELSLVRTKLISSKHYLELLTANIDRVYQNEGRFKQSLAESSFDAWIKFYKQDENSHNTMVSYYTKGALLAFVIDIKIRIATNNSKSLDDAVKIIWKNFKNKGINNNDMQNIIYKISANKINADFFADYLYGLKELPLKECFDYVGIDFKQKLKNKNKPSLSITTSSKNGFAVIKRIDASSYSKKFALAVGDKIIAINDIEVNENNLVSEVSKYPLGQKIKITIFRRKELKHINLKLQASNKKFAKLKLKKHNIKRRKKWLYGI